MPDIFEVFADKATTEVEFSGTKFQLDYRPSVLTPAFLTQAIEDGDGDITANIAALPRTLPRVLLAWDVQVKGETVPIETEALMQLPTVFLSACWEAILGDRGQSRQAKQEGRKERPSSFR